MLTALKKNPVKAGFFTASYEVGQVPSKGHGEEQARVAKLLQIKRVRVPQPGRILGPCSKKGSIATGN